MKIKTLLEKKWLLIALLIINLILLISLILLIFVLIPSWKNNNTEQITNLQIDKEAEQLLIGAKNLYNGLIKTGRTKKEATTNVSNWIKSKEILKSATIKNNKLTIVINSSTKAKYSIDLDKSNSGPKKEILKYSN